MTRVCTVGSVVIARGGSAPAGPAVIAGPCVLESLDLGRRVCGTMHAACAQAGLPFIFKASFDKANRSSIRSARGPGLERGVEWLRTIGAEFAVPVTTDIHEAAQAERVAQGVHLLQIPAFLCRQTDLLSAAGAAAAAHARAVNVKKGQFLSPGEMAGAVRKLAEAGCSNVMLTERGTTFGYHRLVNDFIGIGDLLELPAPGGTPPVCFDATHSTQQPGTGEQTGGRPERAALLARAAVAAGVDAIFMECHPTPRDAMSDSSTMLGLDEAAGLVGVLARVRAAIAGGAR